MRVHHPPRPEIFNSAHYGGLVGVTTERALSAKLGTPSLPLQPAPISASLRSRRVRLALARILPAPPAWRLAAYGVRRRSEAATALWLLRGVGPIESAVAASLCPAPYTDSHLSRIRSGGERPIPPHPTLSPRRGRTLARRSPNLKRSDISRAAAGGSLSSGRGWGEGDQAWQSLPKEREDPRQTVAQSGALGHFESCSRGFPLLGERVG